jgi:hypothetical protein
VAIASITVPQQAAADGCKQHCEAPSCVGYDGYKSCQENPHGGYFDAPSTCYTQRPVIGNAGLIIDQESATEVAVTSRAAWSREAKIDNPECPKGQMAKVLANKDGMSAGDTFTL